MALYGSKDVLKVTRDECKCDGVPSTLLFFSNKMCLKAISFAFGGFQTIGSHDKTISSSDNVQKDLRLTGPDVKLVAIWA